MAGFTVFFVAVALWAVCGAFAYGFTLAYFQREYPYIARETYLDDVATAWGTAALGPLGLLLCWLQGDTKHGLMFSRDESLR